MRIILILCFVSLAISACKTKQRTVSESRPKNMSLSDKLQPTLSNFDLLRLKYNFDEAEIEKQEAIEESISFETAFGRALSQLFLENNVEETPLTIIPDAMESYKGNIPPSEQHRQKLKEFLNDSGVFCLVPLEDSTDACYPPEYGESITQNWVFHFQITSLSDHMYWVIIPRSGIGPDTLYGFN